MTPSDKDREAVAEWLFRHNYPDLVGKQVHTDLMSLLAAARAGEREACAKAIANLRVRADEDGAGHLVIQAYDYAESAIRSRGESGK